MWSSFNENNFFEINWTLNNEFSGTQAGTQSGFAGVGPGEEMYSELRALVSSGKLLYNFLDNHDLGRIASILVDKNKLRDLYQLLFFIPGIPQIYYGSEWGEEAEKLEGTDFNIRPYFPNPKWTDFTSFVSTLAYQHSNDPVMQYGLLEVNELTNTTYEIKRVWNGEERVLRIQL
jgi:glycosidase